MTDFRHIHITDWTEDQKDEAEEKLELAGQLYTSPGGSLKRTDAILSYYEDPPGVSSQALQTNARILELTLPIEMKYLVPPTSWEKNEWWPDYVPPKPPEGPDPTWPPYEGAAYRIGAHTVGAHTPQILAELVPHAAGFVEVTVPENCPEGYMFKPAIGHHAGDTQDKRTWITRNAPGGDDSVATVWQTVQNYNLECGKDFQPGETFYINHRTTEDLMKPYYLQMYQG